jgi:hypothetical protein
MKYPNPLSYDKHIKTKVDKVLNYVYFIDIEHPLANKSGKVYYHRHVMSLKLGKWIDSSYHVHHIDENRQNNDVSNLELVSPSKHGRKHKLHGAFAKKVVKCKNCSTRFITIDDEFCSHSCASSFRNKGGIHNKITKEELSILVWKLPTTKIAQKLECSDVMVGKLCKKLGIKKPNRGYWAKVQNKKGS